MSDTPEAPADVQVGSTVRAIRFDDASSSAKTNAIKGRAIVETIEEDGSVSLLFEPMHPTPASSDARFLVTPNAVSHEVDHERITTLSQIEQLLEFESNPQHSSTLSKLQLIQLWKDRGDQLLRLHDPSSAIPYYEEALRISKEIDVGSSVLIKQGGHIHVAEVDCVDGDEVDVMIPATNKEMVLQRSAILLSIVEHDAEQLQTRILINLTRCLLRLSELSSNLRPKYLQSAVLSSTLAMTIASWQAEQLSPNALTALQLRAKAQAGLSKFHHAMQDAKKLIQHNHPQGKRLLVDLQRQQQKHAKTNKRLAKDVARWVDKATASDSVSDTEPLLTEPSQCEEDVPTIEDDDDDDDNDSHDALSRYFMASTSWLMLILPVIIAVLVHQAFHHG